MPESDLYNDRIPGAEAEETGDENQIIRYIAIAIAILGIYAVLVLAVAIMNL